MNQIRVKYIRSNNQTGGDKKLILFDGVSSSGKTTIGKLFEKDGYKLIGSDDFYGPTTKKVFSEIPNEYTGQDKISKLMSKTTRELMFAESKKYDNVIFDDINQEIIDIAERKNIYVIIIYAALGDLVNNMINRKISDPRGIFVFKQYAKKYVKSNTDTSIDVINRKSFIESLKKMKYEFDDENKLIDFAKDIFKQMDIDDDGDHYVKLRDQFQHDYIINTHDKSLDSIYKELKGLKGLI